MFLWHKTQTFRLDNNETCTEHAIQKSQNSFKNQPFKKHTSYLSLRTVSIRLFKTKQKPIRHKSSTNFAENLPNKFLYSFEILVQPQWHNQGGGGGGGGGSGLGFGYVHVACTCCERIGASDIAFTRLALNGPSPFILHV
jgi:hypothetical protein